MAVGSKEAQKEELEHFYQMAKGVFPGWLMEIVNKAARLYQDRKDKGSRQVQADQIEKQSVKSIIMASLRWMMKSRLYGIVLEPDVEDARVILFPLKKSKRRAWISKSLA